MRDGRVRWSARLAAFTGVKLIAYHNSWPYFARRFRLTSTLRRCSCIWPDEFRPLGCIPRIQNVLTGKLTSCEIVRAAWVAGSFRVHPATQTLRRHSGRHDTSLPPAQHFVVLRGHRRLGLCPVQSPARVRGKQYSAGAARSKPSRTQSAEEPSRCFHDRSRRHCHSICYSSWRLD